MRLRRRATLLATMLIAGVLWPAVPGLSRHAEFPEHTDAQSHPVEEPPPVAPKHPIAQCLADKLTEIRTAHGLAPLPEISQLLHVAQRHSDTMAFEQSMRHSSSEVFPLLPPGWRLYGENVVYGSSCEQMFEAFLESDSHREAMMRPEFDFSGSAVSQSSDGWTYATMVFLDLPWPDRTGVGNPAAPPPVVAPSPAPSAAPPPAAATLPPAPSPPPALPAPGIEVPPVPTISIGAGEPRISSGSAGGAKTYEWLGGQSQSPSQLRGKSHAGESADARGDFQAGASDYVYVLDEEESDYVYVLDEKEDTAVVHPNDMTFDLEHDRYRPVPRASRMA